LDDAPQVGRDDVALGAPGGVDMSDKARALLASVAGFAAPVVGPTSDAGSSNLPVRLATVDTAYTTGLPKVLFDGETVMGARTYASLAPCYAGQRVALLPVGHSYIILGGINATPDAQVVPGTLIEGLWATAPSGFLLLDGSIITRATYPALFAILGTTYNTTGETAAQFRLPDFRGAVLAQKNAATFATLGAKGGEETHTLSTAEIPGHAHLHDQSSGGNLSYGEAGGLANQYTVGFGVGRANTGISTSSAGGGGAHNNLQPYAVVNRAIKT